MIDWDQEYSKLHDALESEYEDRQRVRQNRRARRERREAARVAKEQTSE